MRGSQYKSLYQARANLYKRYMPRRANTLILLIAFVVFISGCTAQTSEKTGISYPTYLNTDYGVEMKYPYGWDVNEEADGIVVAFMSPAESADDRFRESVNLVMNDLSGQGMTLDIYRDIAVEQITGALENVELLEAESATLDGNPAFRLVYSADGTYGRLQFMQLMTIKDDISYILTYTAEPGSFDTYRNSVDSMLDSFRIKPIPALQQPQPAVTGSPASDDNVVGRWRAYSEAIYYDAGSSNYLDTASTRQLYINADGTWEFGTSGGTWRTEAITDADWVKWDTSPYGPERKMVLDGWNDGIGDGPIEEGASRVDFIWIIYRSEASLGPGQVQIKFGHTSS